MSVRSDRFLIESRRRTSLYRFAAVASDVPERSVVSLEAALSIREDQLAASNGRGRHVCSGRPADRSYRLAGSSAGSSLGTEFRRRVSAGGRPNGYSGEWWKGDADDAVRDYFQSRTRRRAFLGFTAPAMARTPRPARTAGSFTASSHEPAYFELQVTTRISPFYVEPAPARNCLHKPRPSDRGTRLVDRNSWRASFVRTRRPRTPASG